MNFKRVTIVLAWLAAIHVTAAEPWRFIVLADWHSAEKYTQTEVNPDWLKTAIADDVASIKMLSRTFGGDLIMLPGDSNKGHWQPSAIVEKGRLCYTGMIRSFEAGGYSRLLMAVGDHELGDNPWPPGWKKSRSQHLFRKAFADAFNMSDGAFRFAEAIGTSPSRPVGTIYEKTSYACRHKNVLFVTVDVFRQDDPGKVIGSQGSVTGSVTAQHLAWLEAVLAEAREDETIRHVFVQAHLPVIYPVRKVNSSGMLMDGDMDSEFWKTLRKYEVDIYFAGEVHANTVTKDPESDLVQIVSRGNFFSNFLTVDVSDSELMVTCHNMTGAQPADGSYAKSGTLTLIKTDGPARIEGTGELALFDRNEPIMHFDFERRFPLAARPVMGLGNMRHTAKMTMIDGVSCTEAFANGGSFGQQYDAHFSGVAAVAGAVGTAGEFTEESRMAVFSMGPHYAGRPVACALWVKTTSDEPMTLINTGSIWSRKPANFMNLNLRGGRPEIMISADQRLVAHAVVSDGKWHHVAVSAGANNARLSELVIYVDGKRAGTELVGKDQVLETDQAVRLGIGCFGYSRPVFAKMGVKPFTGSLDDVMVWARGLDSADGERLFNER